MGALIQFGIITTFLLVFRFPRIQIVFFGLFSLFAAVAGSVLTRRVTSTMPGPRPVPKSPVFWTVSLAIALCSLVFICFLLFGFVTFINSWNSWHRYEGQPFHRTAFVVEQDYYQPQSRVADLYSSGIVDGNREWMDLEPYLRSQNLSHWPRGRAELESSVPPGTSIPVYLFPSLKGRTRVLLYSDTPPAEAYHRTAIKALNYGLGGMAVCALIIFLLIRIRAGYFKQATSDLEFDRELQRS